MSSALVTIITPSYNQGQFLEETILSVHNQTHKNIEHIVIDGASKDNSIDIIKKHQDKFTYWVSEKDEGQTDAINKGLAKATGNIIMWLNSDDILEKDAITKAVAFFNAHPEADMIHGKSTLFGEGRRSLVVGKKVKDLKNRYLAYIPFPQPSSFFRRKIIDETGLLDESLHYGMDYELLVRTALNYNVMYFDELLSGYRLHADSKTNQQLAFCKDWNKIFSRVLNSFDFTDHLITKMSDLGLYHRNEKGYTVKNKFSKANIEKAFLYHLMINMHFYYDALDLKKVKEISSVIKSVSIPFYHQQNIGSIRLRSFFLNRHVISLLRMATRRK